MPDESAFTPWGQGWTAPNLHSPEDEWTAFVASWVRLQRPAVIVETGAGSGRVTAAIADAAPADTRITAVEDDPDWRTAVERLELADVTVAEVAGRLLDQADLCVLDSGRHRLGEIAHWGRHGKPGSYALVHDASWRHDQQGIRSTHAGIADACARLLRAEQARGVQTPNPRGGFILHHR